MNCIKVAIAEDAPYLAKAIGNTVRKAENITLIFTVTNGKTLIETLEWQTRPDLILMDINMPVMNGIEATRYIKTHFPDIKILILTIFDDNENIFEAILAGASGYILKDEKPGKLIEAIESCMDGGAPMSPQIAVKALQILREGNPGKTSPQENTLLSDREKEILEMLAEGRKYQHIADKLFISVKTVGKHIENIYHKLQVHNKVEAIQVYFGKK